MKKIKTQKGFTLAELLIVVAIIAVLVAVSIPIFLAQLEKSREATDIANWRAAKAQIAVQYITGDLPAEGWYDAAGGTFLEGIATRADSTVTIQNPDGTSSVILPYGKGTSIEGFKKGSDGKTGVDVIDNNYYLTKPEGEGYLDCFIVCVYDESSGNATLKWTDAASGEDLGDPLVFNVQND